MWDVRSERGADFSDEEMRHIPFSLLSSSSSPRATTSIDLVFANLATLTEDGGH